MSKLKEQIEKLQYKQKQVDYLNYIKDLVINDTKCIDYSDVKASIHEKLIPILTQLTAELAEDEQPKPVETVTTTSTTFTVDEAAVLKGLVAKVTSQGKAPQNPQQPQSPANPGPKTAPSVSEQMSFAMANRHLANKKVQVINDANVTLTGTVVGLDAPNVVVQTDTGPKILVPIEKVVLS
jgi:hypothetical protein